MDKEQAIAEWRTSIRGPEKSWVLFEYGTCVILLDPEEDLAVQATELLRQWGPVHAGGPAGDCGIVTLSSDFGWAVSGHHKDILTLVAKDELAPEPEEVAVALFGRTKRGMDAARLRVMHVEDKRPSHESE